MNASGPSGPLVFFISYVVHNAGKPYLRGFPTSNTNKIFFLYLSQNICCWYSKESSKRDGSFKYPKYMFRLLGKKIIVILRYIFFLLYWTYDYKYTYQNLLNLSSEILYCLDG